ncbi:MAG: apolipoprotein N-acyltransferase, partial [Pseudomonadota bacterium]
MNKKDFLTAALSGVAMAAIFPGLNIQELGWVCLVPLLAAAHKKEPVQGFMLASIAGVFFHVALLYWLTVSMTWYGGLPLWLSIPILILFASLLGLFMGIPFYVSCYVQKKNGWGFMLTLPFAWIAVEHLKSWFLTGFPWDNLGYSQYQSLPLIQIADITGVYGISFLLVVANCTVFSCMQGFFIRKRLPYNEAIVFLLLLLLSLWYGHQTRAALKNSPETVPVKIALVQPNIPQDIKWDPAYLALTLEKLRRLTLASKTEQPAMIVWPESATPFFYQNEEAYRESVGSTVKEAGAYLLFGSPSSAVYDGRPLYFNSAFLLSPENEITGKYDKVHLVPYGEYVPFQEFFPFI